MRLKAALLGLTLLAAPAFAAPDFADEVKTDYDQHLEALFIAFHKNPELSYVEQRTDGILAKELRAPATTGTGGVGGTAVRGRLKTGDGPTGLVPATAGGH